MNISTRRHRNVLLTVCVLLFLSANLIFATVLPDTPLLGHFHLGADVILGGAALWLTFQRPPSSRA